MRKTVVMPLVGGVDGTSPESLKPAGKLRIGINVEAKPGGGIRRILGYQKFDTNEISGEGPIRGVWYYNGKVYAFRNVSGGASCTMWESSGAGWTAVKTGLTPDGRYSFVNYAFSGNQKMYGASGVHKAFEWDGENYTEITTGMPNDEPKFIAAHRKHLFLSFGNSVQHSSIGDPFDYSAITGANEMLLPLPCTGFSVMPNGSLGIYTQNGIILLSGTSTADWVANNLVEYSNNAGALPYTIQAMGASVRFVDSRGVTDFAASDVSSDFYDAIISHDMDKDYLDRWTQASCATVVRAKNQYRVFFNDGSGLIFVFNRNRVEITRTQFPDPVRCCVNAENASGNELIYFGSDDGFIYQMERGNTFGGDAIASYGELAFSDMGYRAQVKRFHKLWVNTGRSGLNGFYVLPRLYVDNNGLTPSDGDQFDFNASGSYLGEAILGQAILGGAQPITEGQIHLAGIAEWLSLRFYSSTDSDPPWELDSCTVEFSPGRRRR